MINYLNIWFFTKKETEELFLMRDKNENIIKGPLKVIRNYFIC